MYKQLWYQLKQDVEQAVKETDGSMHLSRNRVLRQVLGHIEMLEVKAQLRKSEHDRRKIRRRVKSPT